MSFPRPSIVLAVISAASPAALVVEHSESVTVEDETGLELVGTTRTITGAARGDTPRHVVLALSGDVDGDDVVDLIVVETNTIRDLDGRPLAPCSVAVENLVGDVPSPFPPSESDPGPARVASGTYVEGTVTYASSIDPGTASAIKYLYCYDTGCAAAGPLPLWIALHSIIAGASEIVQADRRRMAARGYLVIVPDLRGRSPSNGTPDLSGRESHDILDAMADARSRFSSVVAAEGESADVVIGGSGGGASALGVTLRAPDSFVVTGCRFGISDYGYDSETGWWAQYSAFHDTALTPWIGNRAAVTPSDRAVLDKYRTRNFVEGSSSAFRHGGQLLTFHNTADGTVPISHSRRLHLALEAEGLTNHAAYESDTLWLHGTDSTYPQNAQAEGPVARYALAAQPWTVPVSAREWRVMGWLRTKRFELWLGAAPDPRTSGGGVAHIADLDYDAQSGVYTVRHVSGPLPMYVAVTAGEAELAGVVADDGGVVTLRVNDPVGIASPSDLPGVVLDLRVDTVVHSSANVTQWTDQSGAGHHFTASAAHAQYTADDGDGHPAISSDGTQHLDCPNKIVDPGADFTFCCVVWIVGSDGFPFTINQSTAVDQRFSIRGTSGVCGVNILDGTHNAAVTPTMSAGAWHFVASRRSNDTLGASVDGGATSSTAITPAAITADRARLFGVWGSPGFTGGEAAKFRAVFASDEALSDGQIDSLRQLYKGLYPLP